MQYDVHGDRIESSDPYGSKYSPYQNQTPYDQIYKKTTKEDRSKEAEKLAREALSYGVVGIFTLGLLFGPWAIVKAVKARKMRGNSTAGFITGILAIIVNISIISYVAFLFTV